MRAPRDDGPELQSRIDGARAGGTVTLDRATYYVADTLRVQNSNVSIVGPSTSSNSSTGARIVWAGAPGGTLLEGMGLGTRVRGVILDGAGRADTLLRLASREHCQVKDCQLRDFTGWGLDVGDGTANLNNFRAENLRILFAHGGSPIRINAPATENAVFDQVSIGALRPASDVPGRLVLVTGGAHVAFRSAVLDAGPSLADYAVRVESGSIAIRDSVIEARQFVEFTACRRSYSSEFSRVDVRSCDPEPGAFAMYLRADGDESQSVILNGLRVRTPPGSKVAPDIGINGCTVVASGMVWDDRSGGRPGKGRFRVTSTGHLFDWSLDGPRFVNVPAAPRA